MIVSLQKEDLIGHGKEPMGLRYHSLIKGFYKVVIST